MKIYKDIIGSWLFFSISTAISILSLLKSFGAMKLEGWLDGFIGLYVRLASVLHYIGDVIPLELTKMDSLIFVSWTFIFIPALVAIYKHLQTNNGKLYLLAGIVFYMAFIFNGISGDSNGGGWQRDVIGNLVGVFFFALLTVLLSVRGGANRMQAFKYFFKNLLGASVICWLLIIAGLASLV